MRERSDAGDARPLYLAKAENKGRTKKEVADRVILKNYSAPRARFGTDMCARLGDIKPMSSDA
jgi:hypothetical protein